MIINYTLSSRKYFTFFFKFCFALFFFGRSSSTLIAQSVGLNIKVNFQDSSTTPPTGWIRDFGQPFGLRTLSHQGSGLYYGWVKRYDNTPLRLSKNGRKRSSPANISLATLMHMQANNITTTFSGTKTEGRWRVKIPNGKYDVKVSVGDGTEIDSKHTINIEGKKVISAFVPTSTQKFKSAIVTVSVSDGYLTIDAIGGTNTKINTVTIQPCRPAVVSVNPLNGEKSVSENTSISTNILQLPNGGINNNTITSGSVYLTETATGAVVPSHVNGTGGGDAITLVPTSSLKLNTTYKFNITSAVKDLFGGSFVPFSSTFTTTSTATPDNSSIRFDKISLPTATGRHSSLTIGPDGKLYAITIDGIIKRFTINPDGTLGTPQLIYSLQDASGIRKQRLSLGFAFDPSATATNLIAWVTNDSYVFINGPDWDGKLTRLSGSNLQIVQDVLINLPRSAKDHVTNSIAFGPDGALYFTQGSTSAMGRADQTWGNRNEHLLSGAVLRLDVSKLGSLPLNVKTSEGGGTYNPYSSNAPLTIYASGTRNAYDLVWHSNGSLYAPTNGSAAGGNTPASVTGTLRTNGTTYKGPSIPALTNVQQTQKDFLFRIVKGGYYGHPNALRGEYVLNGGNPTSNKDVSEVTSYPIGTLPDANWRGFAFDFHSNISPNGAIEYKSSVFNGALKGKLLVVRYSQYDDIITLTPGTSKDIVSSIEGKSITGFSGFVDPLDLTENVKNGNIYVSEYGGNGQITLLKPHTGTTSARAQPINNAQPTSVKSSYKQFPSCDDTLAFAYPTELSELLMESLTDTEKPKVNPNPFQKRFNIEFPRTYEGEFTLQIVDALGKVYDLGKRRLKAGGSNLSIDVSRFYFKPGIYFLKIQSDSKLETIKLLIQ
ncbi:T9SS type A sorting domain-containing protein [Segetibacter koreensis]|uniref:T9SS type A sorting domain-containing protein n=1 Tax=Segetibacter koreensis TaxID=398037 RepID=UPI00036221BC|nr:T9SS type A sorting domain-containing protein [Segetibacter koreensis]